MSDHIPSYKEIKTGSIFSDTPTHALLGSYSGKIPPNGKVDVTYEEAYLRGKYVTIVNENRTPLSLQEVRVHGTKHVGEVVYNIGYINDKGEPQLCAFSVQDGSIAPGETLEVRSDKRKPG